MKDRVGFFVLARPFLLAACCWGCLLGGPARAKDSLEAGFASPPPETAPWCYWYWISDNISTNGITLDLEAMARLGINHAFIGNVDPNPEIAGPVKVLSEPWWQAVSHALREGGRVGVNLGMFNCPGWSQSGGPWVKPEESMRYLAASETHVAGGQNFSGKLPQPKEPFQDVAVLAFPAPPDDGETLSRHAPRVSAEPPLNDAWKVCDGDLASDCRFGAHKTVAFTLAVDKPFTARSLVLYPAPTEFKCVCELQAAAAGEDFRTIREFSLDRTHGRPALGFDVWGPVAVAFDAVTASRFRLICRDISAPGGLAEIKLNRAPVLERYEEKQLGRMWQTPLPLWDAYLWPRQTAAAATNFSVPQNQVLNLSRHLAPDGTLNWTVPPGDWIVLRVGMTPTGVTNGPAAPEASGREIDKLSRPLVRRHFDAYIGEMLRRVPAADRKALDHVVVDSYEMGPQNWTDGLDREFQKRYGYDPLPWLPVLGGRIVHSADASDRFLWDLRRLVADKISCDYVGGLAEISRQHGLHMWLENYGHWGFPGEFLQYGGHADEISGEFWTGGDLGSVELRAASSAAHIYGKTVVTAESWTSGGPLWTFTPWSLKQRGDWAMTEGINHFLLHVYIHQPDEREPGFNAWFGTEFNRHNTWFDEAGDWVRYLERSSFLLQQGRYVADAAYFIGEDTPKMTGIRRPELPPGYAFDYLNAEVIEQRLAVKNGRWVLPDGLSYRLLVLPPLETMRPELLKKIAKLAAAGGAILGEPPRRSPSLQNFPACDDEVKKLAARVWGDCDGTNATRQSFGQGRVFCGTSVQQAMDDLEVAPDLAGLDPRDNPWIHRSSLAGEIYFISNQTSRRQELTPVFRVAGLHPELWDAVTGEHRALPEFSASGKGTMVPLTFEPRQSLFVIFRHAPPAVPVAGRNFPAFEPVATVGGPWQVRFDSKRGGPADGVAFDTLQDWTQRAEPGIKYYSGKAVYVNHFELPAVAAGQKLRLNLGLIHDLARVKLNGRDLGLVWCAPWSVDISQAARTGGNDLEIEVVNTWANRLIGDSALPASQRTTWTALPTFPKPGQPAPPLLPAGLTGPVVVERD